jgi:hypothetical protein
MCWKINAAATIVREAANYAQRSLVDGKCPLIQTGGSNCPTGFRTVGGPAGDLGSVVGSTVGIWVLSQLHRNPTAGILLFPVFLLFPSFS